MSYPPPPPPPGGYPPQPGQGGPTPPPPGGYPHQQPPSGGFPANPVPAAPPPRQGVQPGGPTPPPPGAGGPPAGGYPPPGPAPAKKGSKLPLVLGLGVLVVVALVVAAVVVTQVVGGGEAEAGPRMRAVAEEGAAVAETRAAVAPAVVAADTEALAGLADGDPDPFAEATEVTVGEEVTVTVDGAGYAVVSFETTAEASFSVAATPAGGDAEVAVALLPPEGAPVAPADSFEAVAAGVHRLVVAGDGLEGDVAVTVREIEVIPVDLSEPGAIDTELAEPGDAVAYEHEATAGAHYVVDIDGADLTVRVTDPAGATVATEPDIETGDPRYVADQDGPYRVTIGGGDESGTYPVEIFEVVEYYFYYDGQSVPDLSLEPTTDTDFDLPIDEAEARAHFCVFLREGVTMTMNVRVTSASLDMGIDVYDETDADPLRERINDNGPGEGEVWVGTATEDLRRCFQPWGVDFTGGNFVIDITTES